MSSVQRRIVVSNQLGLHARAATKLVRLSGKFGSKMELAHGEVKADVKSILSLLTLSASQGTELDLSVTGDDAEQAADEICALFDDKFGEGE